MARKQNHKRRKLNSSADEINNRDKDDEQIVVNRSVIESPSKLNKTMLYDGWYENFQK